MHIKNVILHSVVFAMRGLSATDDEMFRAKNHPSLTECPAGNTTFQDV